MNKWVKKIIYISIAISLMLSIGVATLRIKEENSYQTAEIAIRYSDILAIAVQTDVPVKEVLAYFKAQGATTLFVRENTVMPSVRGEYYNYKEQGMANYYEGYELAKIYPNETQIKLHLGYIETFDQTAFEQIYTHLNAKHSELERVQIDGKTYLELKAPSGVLASIGVGFNEADLKVAAELGYTISPQIKSWPNVTQEGIEVLVSQLDKIENLGAIYFADTDIPGFSTTTMQEFVAEHGLGFVEFFTDKQKGFAKLAKASSQAGTNYNVVRLHTLTDQEAKEFAKPAIIERYMLALTERNLHVFLFKMPNTYDIIADTQFLTECINDFVVRANDAGYTLGASDEKYNLMPGNYLITLLVGLAAILVFVLICDLMGFTKTGYLLGAVGLVAYAVLIKVSPFMGIKMMALFGAIMFPTYAVLDMTQFKVKGLTKAIAAFAKMSLISFGGALTIIGTLSRTSFGLAIDIFSGVKIAHLMPILLIVGILVYKKYGLNIEHIKKLLQNKVTYLALAAVGIGAIILLVYTRRTGNTANISGFERQFRALLDMVLGVRPRTKEFLIGHPCMLALIYFGYKEKYLPFLVLGTIGQISLVNTYAHIHTPIVISLIRSGYGILFGMIIGIVLIYTIKIIDKVMKRWMAKVQ